MSAITNPSAAVPPAADPFSYGWRYVRQAGPDGREELTQVPLTLDGVLHPQYGDVMPPYQAHQADLHYLYEVARQRVTRDPSALVLLDVLVLWDLPDMRPHSPDLAVYFGVREAATREWTSFDVAQEGTRPRLIIEVVSPAYRENDTVKKLAHYHRCKVGHYVIVDREQQEGPVQLVGYRYKRRGYQTVPLDQDGWLWVEPLALWLGARGNRVVAYDGDTEAEIGDYVAVTARLENEILAREKAERDAADAKWRADEETRRADDAEARIRDLEEQLRRLQASGSPGGAPA